MSGHGPSTPANVLMALLTQAGVAAPSGSFIFNQVSGALTLARTGAGVYTLTAPAGTWLAGRTFVQATLSNAIGGATGTGVAVVRTSDTVLTISVVDAAGAAVDLEGSLFLEIQVFPL